MPRPLQVDLRPFDLESGIRVTCDVDYLCANFSFPRPLCSRLRPDVRDRRALSFNAVYPRAGHNNSVICWCFVRYVLSLPDSDQPSVQKSSRRSTL